MTKCRLHDIAYGLGSSFISRNNHIDGYWAIGKLYEYARNTRSDIVEFDLCESSSTSAPKHLQKMLAKYCDWVKQRCSSRSTSLSNLSVRIVIEFDIEFNENEKPPQRTYGKPFRVTVAINAKDRRPAIRHFLGYCAPHSSWHESKSITQN